MVEFYSTVHRLLTNIIKSQNSTFETTHLKQLPLNTFAKHTKLTPGKFSTKLEPHRLGPYKITLRCYF